MVVVSTVMEPSLSWSASSDPTSVMEPLTSEVRPTASVSASKPASCSLTR
jgi:hypothetical protein